MRAIDNFPVAFDLELVNFWENSQNSIFLWSDTHISLKAHQFFRLHLPSPPLFWSTRPISMRAISQNLLSIDHVDQSQSFFRFDQYKAIFINDICPLLETPYPYSTSIEFSFEGMKGFLLLLVNFAKKRSFLDEHKNLLLLELIGFFVMRVKNDSCCLAKVENG